MICTIIRDGCLCHEHHQVRALRIFQLGERVRRLRACGAHRDLPIARLTWGRGLTLKRDGNEAGRALYDGAADRSVRWDDPDLAIDWKVDPGKAIVSDKDEQLPFLKELEL